MLLDQLWKWEEEEEIDGVQPFKVGKLKIKNGLDWMGKNDVWHMFPTGQPTKINLFREGEFVKKQQQ